MKIGGRKLIISIIIFVFSVVLLTVSSFAWFRSQNVLPIVLTSGEFEVTMQVNFDNLEVGLNSPYYDQTKKIVIIDGANVNAPNYIGKLSIGLTIKSNIAARFRVKLQDEWQLYRHYFASNTTVSSVIYHERTPEGPIDNPFIIAPTFNHLIDDNAYIYYNGVVIPNVAYTFPIITKGTRYNVRVNDVYEETCIVHLDLFFDIVQANRFSERWDISDTFFN